jgi:chromosomal replication initiation ATPase DnaA
MLIHDCIEAASAEYDVPVVLILGPGRNREQSQARHAAMWLARSYGHPTPKIGRELNRDFSTVWLGAKRAMELSRRDPQYKRRLLSALRNLWIASVHEHANGGLNEPTTR